MTEKELKLLQSKIKEFIDLPISSNKRQEIIDFLLGEFQSLLIDKNISETIFDKDKSKIVRISFGKSKNLFMIATESGIWQMLDINEIYDLATKGGIEKDKIKLYLLK